MSALFDTSVVLDYLRGIEPADVAFDRFEHRAIMVTTWIEVMNAAPPTLFATTRDFLQNFERMSITEAIADRALALMQQHERLRLRHAVPWAAARVNALVYVTADFPKLDVPEEGLWVPYRKRGKHATRPRAKSRA